METSFDQFRDAFLNDAARRQLGLELTDAQAQQVLADPALAQSYHEYWNAALAAQAGTAAPAAAAAGGHGFGSPDAATEAAPATEASAPAPAEPVAEPAAEPTAEAAAPVASAAQPEAAAPAEPAAPAAPETPAAEAAAAWAAAPGQAPAYPAPSGQPAAYPAAGDTTAYPTADASATYPGAAAYAGTAAGAAADAQQTAAYGFAPAATQQDATGQAPYVDPAYAAGAAQPKKKKRTGLWVGLGIGGVALIAIIATIITAFTTAHHWTVIDEPEQPETFYTEEYETGRVDVTMDSNNLCYVDQNWQECIDVMRAEHTANCTGVDLTPGGKFVCDDYIASVEQMQAQGGADYVVVSLGTYGQLTQIPETDTREVSNNDYKPAVTHEAVCYLGFLGECPKS